MKYAISMDFGCSEIMKVELRYLRSSIVARDRGYKLRAIKINIILKENYIFHIWLKMKYKYHFMNNS